jgi:FlaA1/EpsC-like NDP-sugar epimerase
MRPRLLLALWFIADLLLFLGSFALAYFLRVGWIFSTDFPFGQYIAVAALVAPFWLLVLITTRAFSLLRPQKLLTIFGSLVYANIVGSALFALTYYFLYGLFFSRLLLVTSLFLSIVILTVWHIVFARLARTILRRDPPVFPTLVVGVTRESAHLIRTLQERRNPLRPVAILDGHGASEKEVHGVPVMGKLDRLEETLARFGITHLIQCSDLEQSLNLLSACRNHEITYVLLPSVLGIIEKDERTESIEGFAVTMVRPGKRME